MKNLIRVLLINQKKIPHYRVSVYNYLSDFLYKEGFELIIISEGINNPEKHDIYFKHIEIKLTSLKLYRQIKKLKPQIVIYWINPNNLYLIPLLIFLKLQRIKAIYWGHGTDLYSRKYIRIKSFIYHTQFLLSDAIILYAEHLKKYINKRFHNKISIANNTLHLNYDHILKNLDKKDVLNGYNITTNKNIICLGRMQKRKRIQDLLMAFSMISRDDAGLIFVGPDDEGILANVHEKRIYKIGPLYGEEKIKLLSSCDILCIPGAVGLSIVDGFYCGLPIITEDIYESPEIMYLKDGINGFIVPKGDIKLLAEKLNLLLNDDDLRKRFSTEAKREINEDGNIVNFCNGFLDTIKNVIK